MSAPGTARLQELQSELVHVSRLSAMGEMASALAHELNQPLSAITNYMKGSHRLLAGSTDVNAPKIEAALDRDGGRMWAETNKSGGATFRFTLSAVQAKEMTDAAER